MTDLAFKRTTKNLGALGHAYVGVGYRKADGTDVWEDVLMDNDQASHAVPDDTKTFVVRCQILGASGGVVELEVKSGDKILKPAFSREIKPAQAGRTVLEYRVYKL